MKIGVVSDTHSFDIPEQLLKDFKKVDLIVHAGDFCYLEDYKKFTKIAETIAVYGNMDEPRLTKKLPQKKIFGFGGVAIGVYHGRGAPDRVFDVVQEEFKDDRVELVIFGHSHYALNKKVGDVVYFNPGSPNDIVRAPFCSYGLIDITDKKIKAEIIKVK